MTLRAAVLGHPVSHSKSPALHRAAYAYLGVDFSYDAIDVDEEHLAGFMTRVRGNLTGPDAWRGLSVTMPLKAAMCREVDEVRGVGRLLGVINTVAFEPDPSGPGGVRLVGYNTDVAGIVGALRYAGIPAAPTAVVLGGGGTAAAAIAALRELGCPSATILVRDTQRAAEARAASRATGLDVQVLPLSSAGPLAAAADVVISTLPPGAADPLAEALARDLAAAAKSPGVLLDVAYEPWPSRIAGAWQDAGGVVVPGLEMLIYQAVEQVRHFTGRGESLPAEVIDVMCDAVGAPRRVF